MIDKLFRGLDLLKEIVRLPVAPLCFHIEKNPDNIKITHKLFTKPHPKYKVFKYKTLGAALICLRNFESKEKYLDDIGDGKNSGAYKARKAKARGYTLVEIDMNQFSDEIFDINTSIECRQGRPMDASYRERKSCYESIRNFKYYGVLNSQGKLVAYCTLGFYGNFAGFSQIIGYKNNDGIMHFMVVEIACRLIDDGNIEYLMYDTFFGAQPGLKMFKTLLGFKPYRAKYSIS